MDLTQFNIYPKFVPCKNIECENAPYIIEVSNALALIEYMNHEKPNSTFKFNCNKCKSESEYTYHELLNLLPEDKRRKTLPKDQILVLLLVPIKTEKPMDNPAFGELLKAKVIFQEGEKFVCELLDKSLIAPSLNINDKLYCRLISGYIYVFDRITESRGEQIFNKIEKKMPPNGSNLGLFFVKIDSNNNEQIIAANPKCSNPSCNYFFVKTAKTLKELLNSNPSVNFEHDEAYFSLECPICSTSIIVTEGIINSLYPV